MEETAEATRPPLRLRAGAFLDRAETAYLRILRAAILLIATLLIGYALILSAISLYRVAQSPSSVKEKEAIVAPQELAAAEAKPDAQATAAKGGPAYDPAQRRAYDAFLARYYSLFRTRFEPFRQKEDKQLTRAEFDDNFVGTRARLEAASKHRIDFASDIADLQSLLGVMTQAAGLPEAQRKLTGYKAANKVRVCRAVERTRTTEEHGWDRYSTSCSTWYYEPIGCAVTRHVETPYTARECAMKFPEGTQSHSQLFRAYQDRFYALLSERRSRNAAEAEAKRLGIIEGIAKGKLDLWRALSIAAAFLLLMFFFLLIAIERHQRRLSGELAPSEAGPEPAA
jgi:hypothetical protein